MPRRKVFILSGILLCWLLAGISGGRVQAEAGMPLQTREVRLT